MGRKNERDTEYSAEGGTSCVSGSGVFDWGGSDGFSLSDSASETPKEWKKDLEDREETDDTFQ
ncbi:hypothetical protein [Paenibacillus durus]|uniref:Uncharacterized protein n=1 Tax=Paenibacillus durus ATCC 35681 TaxID=1333534 RepID=A0A0F7F7A2_PAEDU|nr:hypothetical protein [Paenibacillus durus]AKG33222.1 hypothetical protein VK70_00170 [Paenibacillus durus ATCC 35681]